MHGRPWRKLLSTLPRRPCSIVTISPTTISPTTIPAIASATIPPPQPPRFDHGRPSIARNVMVLYPLSASPPRSNGTDRLCPVRPERRRFPVSSGRRLPPPPPTHGVVVSSHPHTASSSPPSCSRRRPYTSPAPTADAVGGECDCMTLQLGSKAVVCSERSAGGVRGRCVWCGEREKVSLVRESAGGKFGAGERGR